MNKELFIIRHGETDFNLQGIVQGRGVNPSLNETGRKQAQMFFNNYKDEAFEVIYTSTLQRTHETVKSFISKGIRWEQSAALDEISWGVFEGKRADSDFKALYRKLIDGWSMGDFSLKAPGGESPLEVQLRQSNFLASLLQQQDKKILICMHGRAMRIFLPTMLQKSLLTMDEFPHHNLTLYKLVYSHERFSVELFNNLEHLYEE